MKKFKYEREIHRGAIIDITQFGAWYYPDSLDELLVLNLISSHKCRTKCFFPNIFTADREMARNSKLHVRRCHLNHFYSNPLSLEPLFGKSDLQTLNSPGGAFCQRYGYKTKLTNVVHCHLSIFMVFSVLKKMSLEPLLLEATQYAN